MGPRSLAATPSIPPDTVDAFDAALTRAGVRHQLHRYAAPHAFANPSNPRHDARAAEDAWMQARAFPAHLLEHTTW